MSDDNVDKLEDSDDEENDFDALAFVATATLSAQEENAENTRNGRNAGAVQLGNHSTQDDCLDEKLKDPNSTVVPELMGPPELRRNDESRPGAFRSGGNLRNTEEPRMHELLDSASSAHPTADLVLNAELVNEPAVEYVRAEPLSLSAGDDDDDSNDEHHERERRMRLFKLRLKHRYFPVAILLAGVLAVVVGVVLTTKSSDTAKDSPFPAQPPSRPPGHKMALVSLHAVVWGYRTDCDKLDPAPLQIDCQGQVEVLLTDNNTSDCSTPAATVTTCDLQNNTAIVIFRCLNSKPDLPLAATVTFPVAKAHSCHNRQQTSNRGLRTLSSSTENVTFGGKAETFLSLGRFCEDAGILKLHSNYSCQSGETTNPYTQGRRVEKQGESTTPYCSSSESCEESTMCPSNRQVTCVADCSMELNSLTITDADAECFIAAGHGDGAINDTQLQNYLNIVREQMILLGLYG